MPLHRRALIAGFPVIALLVAGAVSPRPTPAAAGDKKPPVDFARQIRPILSDNCFTCHGPDDEQRKAKLRLDSRDGATKELRSGGRAVVPGDPKNSVLLQRILSHDDDERMPPARTNKKVTEQQAKLIEQWIAEGASWSEHWAFVAPKRPPLPAVKKVGWAKNAIDRFILARMEAEGLEPSAEADKARLLRRLTFDLTGLPPTLAELDAFLADTAPDAYEKAVDRLLASPHFGERLALDWLDAARYADTHGYHIDAGRDMTRWREWVIDSFNTNLPYDRFIVEQLAGDLLPNAGTQQKIASGFNRNHMINFEGGAIPEEYLTAYIVDRVNTTATVFLGLTVACAQCHDHKFDPISQKEFYQLYAFFNNVPENGLDGSKGNAAPMLRTPTKKQQDALDRIDAALTRLEKELTGPMPPVDAAQAEWEKSVLANAPVKWSPVDLKSYTSAGGATLKLLDDGSIFASGTNPANEAYTVAFTTGLKQITAVRVEALPDKSFAAKGPGRSNNGNLVLTDVRLAGKGGDAQKWKAASASFSQADFPVQNAIDADKKSGWAIYPEIGKPHFAVFELATPLAADGTLTLTLDFQSQFAQHQFGRFRVSVTDAANPHTKSALPPAVAAALAVEADRRSDAQKETLRIYYRQNVSTALKGAGQEIAKLKAERAAIEKQVPTTMVMQELPRPRETHMLIRGEYNKKGAKVTAGVPAALPLLPKDAPPNRLGLAKWLVEPSHPLTARVAVNRYWQMFFGTGLVKTQEDFGSQGEPPSHPELLDWLAVEFMTPTPGPSGSNAESGWDVKALVRLIVTSATYRQSGAVSKQLHARDPENRLLARGPRLRLQAEFIRDQALAISGLLNAEIGGASVFPYQPKGLWQELASRGDSKNWSAQFYEQSHGKDLYRRTMYTFLKRTSPPPTLTTFDAPDRETCTVRRSRTNTPLQALVLMNDPTYVEAARKLAERVMTEAQTVDDRLALAFRLATGRRPNEKELGVLRTVFNKQQEVYRQNQKAALQLLAVGESSRNDGFAAPEVAAYAIVASVVLNLDETVTK
jgi:hypothetical protein